MPRTARCTSLPPRWIVAAVGSRARPRHPYNQKARRDAFADTRRRIAYERLLLDLLDGDPTLFVRRDEVEAQWQWIDGVRKAWEEAGLAPKSYGAGSWGPSSAVALTERDGVQWHE